MDSLPSEVLVEIFKYLPGKDNKRFEQLSTFYKDLCIRNQRFLPQVSVSITLGGYGTRKNDRLFSLKIEALEIKLAVRQNGKIRLQKSELIGGEEIDVVCTEEARKFLNSFYEYVSCNRRITKKEDRLQQKDLFFKWILGRVNLQFIDFIRSGNYKFTAQLLSEAVETTKFRCPLIKMTDSFHLLNPFYPLDWDLLPKLCGVQEQNTRGRPKLLIKVDQTEEALMYHSVEILNLYATWFSDVVCEFPHSFLMKAIYAIASRWHLRDMKTVELKVGHLEINELTAINFKLLFNYEEPRAITVATRIWLEMFLKLNHSVVDKTKNELLELLGFEGFGRLNEIVCRRNDDGEILRFNFTKFGRFLRLSVEFK